MASSDVKIRVFFVLDIQGFAKSSQNNQVLRCGYARKSDFIGMMERMTAISCRVPVSEA